MQTVQPNRIHVTVAPDLETYRQWAAVLDATGSTRAAWLRQAVQTQYAALVAEGRIKEPAQ